MVPDGSPFYVKGVLSCLLCVCVPQRVDMELVGAWEAALKGPAQMEVNPKKKRPKGADAPLMHHAVHCMLLLIKDCLVLNSRNGKKLPINQF